MEETQLAWAAGFFEGEGAVGITKSNSLVVEIINTNNIPIDFFGNNWNGYIHPGPRPRGNRKTSSKWMAHSNNAYKFLSDIKPYIIFRGEQIRTAMSLMESDEWLGTGKGRWHKSSQAELDRRKYLFDRMQLLNKRGKENGKHWSEIIPNEYMLNNKQLLTAWTAGFFEGEGNIYSSKNYNIQVGFSNTKIYPLSVIRYLFNGSIGEYEYDKEKHANWSKIHKLVLCGQNARNILIAIGPYILYRMEQVIIGLEMHNSVNKHELYERLIKLNKRGVI